MKERFNLSLSSLWFLISAAALMLPVFLPSSANPQNFLENIIGTATVTMFILSFPSSLFGLPVMFFAQIALDVDPNTMQGMYLNLFLLFAFGSVQWFWIVPRLLRNEPRIQMLNLLGAKSELQLSAVKFDGNIESYDSQGRTPVERIIHEKDSEF